MLFTPLLASLPDNTPLRAGCNCELHKIKFNVHERAPTGFPFRNTVDREWILNFIAKFAPYPATFNGYLYCRPLI
jgi:hypothetical protein